MGERVKGHSKWVQAKEGKYDYHTMNAWSQNAQKLEFQIQNSKSNILEILSRNLLIIASIDTYKMPSIDTSLSVDTYKNPSVDTWNMVNHIDLR